VLVEEALLWLLEHGPVGQRLAAASTTRRAEWTTSVQPILAVAGAVVEAGPCTGTSGIKDADATV
jgi:hypothetical protein